MENNKPRKILGRHKVRLLSYQYDAGDSVAGKPPRAVCKLQILEGHRKGETLWWNGYLSENWQVSTAKGLRALGMTNDNIVSPEWDTGRMAIAVERENPGSSKYKSSIDFIDSIDAPRVKNPVPAKEASKIASQFRHLFRTTPALPMDESLRAPTVEYAPSTREETPTVSTPTETDPAPF